MNAVYVALLCDLSCYVTTIQSLTDAQCQCVGAMADWQWVIPECVK